LRELYPREFGLFSKEPLARKSVPELKHALDTYSPAAHLEDKWYTFKADAVQLEDEKGLRMAIERFWRKQWEADVLETEAQKQQRFCRLADAMEEALPDIFLLQVVTSEFCNSVLTKFMDEYSIIKAHHDKGKVVVLLKKMTFTGEIETVLQQEVRGIKAVLAVRTTYDGAPLLVIANHGGPPEYVDDACKGWSEICKLVKAAGEDQIILGGDFNMTPELAVLFKDGKALEHSAFQNAGRWDTTMTEQFTQLSGDLRAVLRRLEAAAFDQPTYWKYQSQQGAYEGQTIDHIWTNMKITSVHVPEVKDSDNPSPWFNPQLCGSDHVAVKATLASLN